MQASINTAINTEQPFETIDIDINHSYQSAWVKFLHPGRPVMTTQLLEDFSTGLNMVNDLVQRDKTTASSQQIQYLVLSSAVEGVFNLGGDLEHFLDLITRQDRQGLSDYGHACTDILVRSMNGDEHRLCSIALVEGESLGGGFEAALAADVLIAEKRARFGFPETQFGLFPGMGAFSFLARKLTPALAKRLMTSGRIYTAEELYDMGVVDVLVEDGRGEEMVHHYIRRRQQREGGFRAMDTIMSQHNPVSHQELESIVDLWVDTALQLNKHNLDMMRYLLRAQTKRWGTEHLQQNDIQKAA
jgi:DSF synthase